VNSIADVLNILDPISLKEMDSVKLMDRVDTKYVFSSSKLPLFLEAIKDSYRVLAVNEHRVINYQSLYFDTKDYELYRQHHCGWMNRYKVRFRKYVESNLNFFEIKFKSNKGRTVKKRISCRQIEEIISGNEREFLKGKTDLSAADLCAVMWTNYTRITLVNRYSPERVTIDSNLSFRNERAEKSIPRLAVAEVKQEKSVKSPFGRLMKSNRIREGFISKYCFGISSLVEGVKKNNFKPRLIQLNKLNQHDTANFE